MALLRAKLSDTSVTRYEMPAQVFHMSARDLFHCHSRRARDFKWSSDLPDGRTSGNHQLSPARVSVMFSGRGEADGSGDD